MLGRRLNRRLTALLVAFSVGIMVNARSADNTGSGGTVTYADTNGLNPVSSPPYVGGYVVHTFTANGTLTLPSATNADVLMVAGGGGGGGSYGDGGGAGGLIYTNIPLSGASYGVTVGAGGSGTGANTYGANGTNSVFSTLTALGGGGGGAGFNGNIAGRNGGSGGGGGGGSSHFGGGAATQPTNSNGGYGHAGATGTSSIYGGGGGAGAAATTNNGGAGLQYAISGATNYYAGGGGGISPVGTGGLGGGGSGGASGFAGGNGAANTGGGGGGGWNASGGSGGSGIVIVRYPYVPGALPSVAVSSPGNGQGFLSGASISAAAAVANGTGPYSVTYYYKLTNNPTYTVGAAVGPFGATNTFIQILGTLPVGAYQIYATVTDSAAGTNTSVTNTFTVSVFTADFTAEQWRVAEIPLTSSVTYADPFNNVDVTATFTGPGGVVLVRPGFWDGTNTWRIRFAPTVVGQWSMTTACTDPANSGLQGVARGIQCNAYTGTNAIFQHGFLKVSPNGRYFTYADGTPFIYLGDTHWLYLHERFQTSNVPGVASEFKYTVDKRVAQGFTVFQSEAIHIPHGGVHTNADEELQADLTDGLTAADLPGFWNSDQKFAYLADHGLVHANGFITWTGEPANNAIYTTNYMARLGRYWAARYGAYPVLWTTAQELDPNVYGLYNSTTIGLWYAGAQAVATNDAYAQPLGVHMQSNGNGMNSPADSWWGGKPYHKWWPMQLQGEIDGTILPFVQSFWTNVPAKPIVLYESMYEDFWTTTDGARSDAYKAFQWGMCGYGYGANGVWNDTYDYSNSDWGTAYYMPGSYLKWYDGANLLGAAQLTYLKNFYTALNWWNLTPRFNDPAWGSFADPNESLLSSDSNTTYVVYFFGSASGTGTLKGMAPGIPYEASWFNPRTGIYTDIGGFTPTAGQWTAPVTPDSNDWILLVKQNPSTMFPSPANAATVTPSLAQVSWTNSGSSSNLSYGVYFGSAADYDPGQPYGNLVGITPAGGTTNQFAALPAPLQAGTTYYWLLAVANPTTGNTNFYAWTFTVVAAGTGSVAVGNPSFETPMPGSVNGGWAQIGSPWVVQGNSPYQQNNLSPTGGAHFTGTSPGGGAWCALINSNTISIAQDLLVSVNVGDTVSMTFYGGRAQASASTAAGGVFNAALLVGSTPYSLPVNTAVLANDSWQSYTLTRVVTNSGELSLQFSAVSGNPWLDNLSSITISNATSPPAPVLSVTVTSPAAGQSFLTGSSITATATVTNGTGPYTVTYYTNAVGGTPAVAGAAFSAPYAVGLDTLTPGTYRIYATVADSASPTANTSTSFTRTFTVASAMTIPVANGSFETTGSQSGGWAHIAAGWNPANNSNSQYQENNVNSYPSQHFTAISPGGGVWYALLNGNTVSITQDLLASVKAGDTLSMTFYGGRARDGSVTAEGGVFSAAFLVGSTPYSLPVDTTGLANNTWQSYTLTQVATNAGDLSIQFSAVSGDPWLDNISNVALTPAPTVPPVLGAPRVSGGSLIVTGTGGTPGAGYTWLTTTNLSAPVNWTTNSTGTLDGTGAFSNSIPVGAIPASFFRLRLP